MKYSEVSEDILSSVDLQSLARKHRAKSDFDVSYHLRKIDECEDSNDSTCDPDDVESEADEESGDDSALNEDGLSDSEFDEADGNAGGHRQRLDTFDAYESEVAP